MALRSRSACAFRANSSMNDDFFSITQRRKGAKFRCLFLEKILIHTPIQQRLNYHA
jgi:hypothetical protein